MDSQNKHGFGDIANSLQEARSWLSVIINETREDSKREELRQCRRLITIAQNMVNSYNESPNESPILNEDPFTSNEWEITRSTYNIIVNIEEYKKSK